jgi:hypothetical protein
VNQYCTCGAKLPDDARFCHKCGKPQYDDVIEGEEHGGAQEVAIEPAPAPVPPPPVQPAGVNFRNPAAVRGGMTVAAVVSLLLSVPLPPPLNIFWQIVLLTAAGFLAVYLYHRRTGHHPSMREGARLGWITGMFCFLIMMILFTISVLSIAQGVGLRKFFTEMVGLRGTPEVMEQLNVILQSPVGLASVLVGILLMFFVMMTALPVVGGVLGAKILERD